MKVKALDEFHLLLILSASEADSLGLTPQSLRMNTLACRLTMARLFTAACERTGFLQNPSRCIRDILEKVSSIGIHAMPTVDGQYLLLFSTHPSLRQTCHGKRRRYRVKQPPGPFSYRFPCCGDALNAIERLFRSGLDFPCQFFCCDGQYFLILSPDCRSLLDMKAVLAEYGSLWGKGKASVAFLHEHGRLLACDAIAQVGPCLI